jgi:ABC-2 type transport system permease protein
MIWRKAWLESRGRFLLMAVALTITVLVAILDAERQMARYDRIPPMTFPRYVSIVYGGQIQLVWVAACVLLGLGGLLREHAIGTAQYSLALPISRKRWMAVRAAIGITEAAILAFVPVIVIPVTAAATGRSYPPLQALNFSMLMLSSGIVFVFAGIFYSSLLPSDFAAVGLGGISLYFVFNAQNYLYSWFPHFNMSRLLSGFEFIDLRTGFLTAWPWSGILGSVAIAGALFWSAVELIQRRDF